MSDNTATSGATTDTSGSASSLTSTSGDATGNTEKHSEKLLKEKENWKNRALESEKKLSQKVEDELKAKEDYKRLYESAKARGDDLEQKLQTSAEKTKAAKVDGAILTNLKKLGLADEHVDTALKLFDRNAVTIDAETEVVLGVEDAVKSFHEKHAGLNFWKKSAIGVNRDAPRLSAGAPKPIGKMTTTEKVEALRQLKQKA